MNPLAICWIISAVLAASVGIVRPRPFKIAAALCVGIAVLAWGASYPLMLAAPRFGADTTLAEDYVNDFGRAAVLYIAVALGWTFLWFLFGLLAALAGRRIRRILA